MHFAQMCKGVWEKITVYMFQSTAGGPADRGLRYALEIYRVFFMS